jgi:hypothetical protein
MIVDHQGLDNEQGIDRICLGLPDSGLAQSCSLYGIDDRYSVPVIMKKAVPLALISADFLALSAF